MKHFSCYIIILQTVVNIFMNFRKNGIQTKFKVHLLCQLKREFLVIIERMFIHWKFSLE